MTKKSAILLLVLGLFTITVMADDVSRVMDEAQNGSSLENNLRVLTDEIGGRVPGTPAMQRAIEWGVAGFKTAGADDVHTEQFAMPVLWREGATQISVVAPVQFMVRAVSVAWAPALPAVRHVQILDVGSGSAEEFKRAGNVEGAVVLVHSKILQSWDDLFEEYLRADGI